MRASFVLHLKIKVLESGGRVEKLIAQSCLKSIVKFPQSVMIWGAMSSAGIGSLCFLKTNVTAPVYQEIFDYLMLPFADQLNSTQCWFHFPAGFGTCPHCQKHQKLVKWPWCWCAWLTSKLTRPEPHREYMRNKRPKNADELKATVKETWASIPPQQCHKLITSMPRQIEAVIKAKGAPTKYIYSKWTYFPEGQQFTKNVYFLLVLWSILISLSELVGFC